MIYEKRLTLGETEDNSEEYDRRDLKVVPKFARSGDGPAKSSLDKRSAVLM